jgi:hypothetical protein
VFNTSTTTTFETNTNWYDGDPGNYGQLGDVSFDR